LRGTNLGEETIQKSRWKILINVIAFTFMSSLDASIVNVALPTISDKLGTGLAAIAWVVTIYLITITAFIIFFGKIADLTGKTRMFTYGVILFVIGSLLCGISNSYVMLLIARVIQAIGAAAGMATNQGIIVETFHHTERGRALGISGASVALGNMTRTCIRRNSCLIFKLALHIFNKYTNWNNCISCWQKISAQRFKEAGK